MVTSLLLFLFLSHSDTFSLTTIHSSAIPWSKSERKRKWVRDKVVERMQWMMNWRKEEGRTKWKGRQIRPFSSSTNEAGQMEIPFSHVKVKCLSSPFSSYLMREENCPLFSIQLVLQLSFYFEQTLLLLSWKKSTFTFILSSLFRSFPMAFSIHATWERLMVSRNL